MLDAIAAGMSLSAHLSQFFNLCLPRLVLLHVLVALIAVAQADVEVPVNHIASPNDTSGGHDITAGCYKVLSAFALECGDDLARRLEENKDISNTTRCCLLDAYRRCMQSDLVKGCGAEEANRIFYEHLVYTRADYLEMCAGFELELTWDCILICWLDLILWAALVIVLIVVSCCVITWLCCR